MVPTIASSGPDGLVDEQSLARNKHERKYQTRGKKKMTGMLQMFLA